MSDNPTPLEVQEQELETLRSEIAELDALEEPTEEQSVRYDAALAEWDDKKPAYDKAVARAAKVSEIRSAALDASNREAGFGAPEVKTRKVDPFENVDQIRFSYDDAKSARMDPDIVSRAVTAVTDYRPHGISDDEVQRAVHAIETIPGAAQHALIHGSPAYRSAFETWMQVQGQSPIYTPQEQDAVRTAMSLTGANGGYTLPTLLDPTLIHTGTASKNPMRQISRVVSGTQNVWHGVSVGNVTSYWTAEAAAMTEGSPTLANPTVTAYKLTAYLKGSYEIFEDSNLQAQLPGLIGESFSYMESDAFVAGSGSGAPRGVITAISGTAASTVTASSRGTFAYGDLTALHDAVPSRYEDEAVWLGNKAVFTAVRAFASGSNGSLFWANLGSDTPPLLIDSPYYKASALGSATTSGSAFLIYGAFRQYLIYDRIGTQVEFVQNTFNSSALPTGERALIAHKRVGGDVLDVNAFRFLKG